MKTRKIDSMNSAFEFSAAEPRHVVAKIALGPPNDLSLLQNSKGTAEIIHSMR
uniref:Uncharacterized protein n=1 Tax=Agrobacterium tumefaciens TaxID=358 RepID=A0A2P0QJI8_AGRTU|nr:hypothetical protein AgrTiChry5_12 [Agrobacterium tumefaciens]